MVKPLSGPCPSPQLSSRHRWNNEWCHAEICLEKLPLCLSIRDQASMNATIMCALTTSHAFGPVPNEPKGNSVIDLNGSRGRPSTAWGSSSLPVPLQERCTWSQGGCFLYVFAGLSCQPSSTEVLRGPVLYSAPLRKGACTTTSPQMFWQKGLRTWEHRGQGTRPHLSSWYCSAQQKGFKQTTYS